MTDTKTQLSALQRQKQKDLINDQFLTRCAYDQEHVIKSPRDPNNHKFTTREK